MIIDIPAITPGGQHSYILHEQASRFEAGGEGWLSLKRFFGGAASYRAGSAAFRVDDTCLLVLDHGQPYEVEIDADEPVESLCFFFAPRLAALAVAAAGLPTEDLLDQPDATGRIHWIQRTYPASLQAGQRLAGLRIALKQGGAEPAWLAEQELFLMRAMLVDQQRELAAADGLRAARPATREELYRRLHLARDYAMAHLHEPLTIGRLADVAGMSANHLLRSYQQLFGRTPYQHILALRLERAKSLLDTTDMPITQVGTVTGFERPSAFSWRFQQRYGMSPRAYRRTR